MNINSGVYLLTFNNGDQYVGKTVDFERRFSEHVNSMKNGSAAKRLLASYRVNGLPKARILVKCHPDHIDLMESYYICKLQPNLNSMDGVSITNNDLKVLEVHNELLQASTVEHLLSIVAYRSHIDELKEKLTGHKMYDLVEEQDKAIQKLQAEKEELQVELAAQSGRKPWYRRLFGM